MDKEQIARINKEKDWCIEELQSYLNDESTSKGYLEDLASSLYEQAQNLLALAKEIELILEQE